MNPSRLRQARLASGLVMLAYVTMHLTAHAFGLISLDAQQAAGDVVDAVWDFGPVTWALYAALGVHMALAMQMVIRRRKLFVFTGAEARATWQMWLGLTLPLLLASHVIANKWGNVAYGVKPSYEFTLASAFAFAPFQGVLLAIALVATWSHAMLGLDQWLRFKPWFTGGRRELGIAVAVALPLASLAGYLASGRAILQLTPDPDWIDGYIERLGITDDAVYTMLGDDTWFVRVGFLVLLAAALATRFALKAFRRRSRDVTVDYLDGPKLRVPSGSTLLDISREAGVPHASICGGRGRCSTCRVRLLDSDPVPPPHDADERRLLARAYASPRATVGSTGPMRREVPDDVRLACQWRPQGIVRVARLLPPETGMVDRNLPGTEQGLSGEERVITVMFADMRNFTGQSERRLPFDVVYLINAFAKAAGEAIEAEGGRVDKFLGDGVMALFGAEGDVDDPAGAALRAAAGLLEAVDALSERLAADLDSPLGVAIGLHHGPAIVGEIGYGAARGLTAIGDTVNTAARLEAISKSRDAAVSVSRATLETAGRSCARCEPIDIRGRLAKLDAAVFADQNDFKDALGPA